MVSDYRSSKFERVFNYTLIGVLIVLGLLVISGVFRMGPNFRIIFGGIILVYGFLRFLLLKNKYRKEQIIEEKKE
jgi:uncharacterized membrane protein YedE/YeeE